MHIHTRMCAYKHTHKRTQYAPKKFNNAPLDITVIVIFYYNTTIHISEYTTTQNLRE